MSAKRLGPRPAAPSRQATGRLHLRGGTAGPADLATAEQTLTDWQQAVWQQARAQRLAHLQALLEVLGD